MFKKSLVKTQPKKLATNALWQPVLGEATVKIIEAQKHLSSQERDLLRKESLSILSQCIPPLGTDNHRSGLVVGNIQSGKTLSFATVAALAQDNDYRLVIVITGTKKNLNSQSVKRLIKLLDISRSNFTWKLLRNPKATQNQDIPLEYWKTSGRQASQHKTVLITVLKNHARLKSLAGLLNKLNLHGIPALVIDDEADQAGLNTNIQQDTESSTYRELNNIRKALPHHTYLGYYGYASSAAFN